MRSRAGSVSIVALLLVLGLYSICAGNFSYIAPKTFTINYINDQKQIDSLVKVFRKQLHTQAPNVGITGCNNVSRVSLQGRRDFAMGAACGIQSGNRRLLALLCEDSRSGRLVYAASETVSRDKVIEFIENNCLSTASR
ncbi:MAG: hypothetical protein ACP5IL_13325 [Syntrophobacteraceae bacterium]